MAINNSKVLCIYHSRDLDGWTSAAIVKDGYPNTKLIGWDYGDPVPDIDFYYYDLVFLVDISFPPETMKNLLHHAIWIDHHISAIKDSEEHGYSHMEGIRNIMEYAACELIWKYLHTKEMPRGVELAGLYDSFRHKTKSVEVQKRVMNFQYAARAHISNPEEAVQLLTMAVGPWIEAGGHIFNYMKTEAKSIVKSAFPIELLGHKGMMVNAVRFNPSNFEIDYNEEFFGCFHYTGKNWSVSLYSEGKMDVSIICKDLGGGGHAGAAGFQIDTIDKLNSLIIKKY